MNELNIMCKHFQQEVEEHVAQINTESRQVILLDEPQDIYEFEELDYISFNDLRWYPNNL